MKRDRYFLIVLPLFFTAVFFIYYPPTYAIVDEAAYLSTAYSLQHGTAYYDRAGINQEHMAARIRDHQISRYPPGNSILLLPFTIIHWRLTFIRGWLLTVAGYLFFILILRHYRLPEVFSALFLFHPTILLYSRTIMSDLPALVFVLAGLYAWLRKKPLWAGFILGLSAGIRYPNILIPGAWLGLTLIKKEFRAAGLLLVGAILGVFPLLIYNRLAFGTLWGAAAGYGTTFSPSYLPRTLFVFILSLTVLYPFMSIGFFFWKDRDRWIFLAPALVTLIFYGFQSYFDQPLNILAGLIMNLRYLLPIIPLFLIPYIGFLSRWKGARSVLPVFIASALVFSVFLSSRHQRYLRRELHYQKELYSHAGDGRIVICNKDIYELINPYVKFMPFYPFEIMHRLQPVERFRGPGILYLACRTRDADTQDLFRRVGDQFSVKEEIYSEAQPEYFSIWRVGVQNKP
jgi:hypothetical protein